VASSLLYAITPSAIASPATVAGSVLAMVAKKPGPGLMPFLAMTVLALTLAAVSGLMVSISFDELTPGPDAYGFDHLSVIGITAGMALMAVSIWLLR